MSNGFTDEMINSGQHLAEDPGDPAAALINFVSLVLTRIPVSRLTTGNGDARMRVTQRVAIFS
jgi:hypothetical protein